MSPKFSPGQIRVTDAAYTVLEDAGQKPDDFLIRHPSRDWGDASEETKPGNDR
jgi:hypothetical protein